MKLRQLYEGVGRITTQNQTSDVGPNEIKTQAAKFGNVVDRDGKPKYTFHSKAHKNSDPNTLFNLGMTESKDITYTKPNLNNEWDEAERYEEFKKIGKDKWIDLVKKGNVVEYNTKTVQKMSNTDAVNVKDFDNLDKNKQQRALKQLETGSIELPIVASYSDGHLELVGGNTRFTAIMKETGKGKVWQFNVPDAVAKLAEGKSPHKKGTAKYKKHMAAKHANMAEGELDDINKRSEIYVDMDGVLVDFFGALTKLMGVKDWKQISNVNVGLDKIRNTPDFWTNLKPTSNANNLLGIIKTIKGSYKILSAPMADDHRVEPSKREWVKKHLKAFPPDDVIITTNKKQYAVQKDGTPNILIDDFGQNVAKWESAGGIGFKHKDHKFERTAKALDKHFKEGELIPNPKNSFAIDTDTPSDYLRVGTNIANIKKSKKDDKNAGEPSVMIAPYGGKAEKKHLKKNLKRIGYKTKDVDGNVDSRYDTPEAIKISEGDLRMKYADFKDFVADKVKQPQKGYGKREFDPRLLKKIYELLSGHDVTWDGKNYTIHDYEHSPRAIARKGRNPATENITEDNTQAITNLNEFVNRFSRMANLWNKSFSQSVMGPVPKPLTDDVNIKIRGIIQNLSKPQTPENLAGMSKAILQVKQRLDQFIALMNKTAQGNQMFQKPLTQFMLTLSNNASNVMPGPFITAMQGLLQKTAIQLKAGKSTTERELSKGEEKEKERIVKGMKKDKKGFAKRYGDDAKAVMYATATKLAKA